MTHIKTKLDELKNIREMATVGPWIYSEIIEKDELGIEEGLCGVDVVSSNTQDVICNLDYDQKSDWRDSAKFIVAAENNWTNLLDALGLCVAHLERCADEHDAKYILTQIREKIGCE